MSAPRSQKRQLEMARLERAARKRDRRQGRGTDDAQASDGADARADGDAGPQLSESEVLEALADLHRRFADDEIDLDEFETQREALSQHLRIN